MRIEDFGKNFGNLDFSIRIADWKKEDMYDFILASLTVMSSWTESKLNYYFKDGEEESTLDGWVDCLKVFTANAIIITLESVRDGNYKKYEDLIPRSAIDFKHFVLNGNHRKSSVSNNQISNVYNFPIPDKSPDENKSWFNSLTEQEKNRNLQQALDKFPMLKYHLEHNKVSVLDDSFPEHFLFKMLMEILGRQKESPRGKSSNSVASENLKKIREILKGSFKRPSEIFDGRGK